MVLSEYSGSMDHRNGLFGKPGTHIRPPGFSYLCHTQLVPYAGILFCHRKINLPLKKNTPNSFISTIVKTLLLGLGNAIMTLVAIQALFQTSSESSISILQLNLIPSLPTFLLYIGLGISFYAVGFILFTLNRLLLVTDRSRARLTSSLLILGFFLGLFTAQLFIPESLRLNWAFWVAVTGFIIIFICSYLDSRRAGFIKEFSTLRF